MRAHRWWELRRAWHVPSVYEQCCWPTYSCQYFLRWDWACILHILRYNLLWRDMLVFWRRAYRGFRVLQPLGCKSWHRRKRILPAWYCKWTVRVCEWLEERARAAEELEEERR